MQHGQGLPTSVDWRFLRSRFSFGKQTKWNFDTLRGSRGQAHGCSFSLSS